MIRTALDSENPGAFTTNADFILTYSDIVPDARAFEARYPHQQVAYIDRRLGDPGSKATIADVETGALTIADLVPWFDERFHAGMRWLTHYCNRDNLPAVKRELNGRIMWEWVATLDGTVHVDGYVPLRGPDLVQILGAGSLGINADFSLVLNPTWRPSPPATVVAPIVNVLDLAARSISTASGDLATGLAALRALE